MKNFLTVIFSIIALVSYSQDKDLKWELNTGTNMVIYNNDSLGFFENMTDFDRSNIAFPLSTISLARHLGGGFSPELKFAVNKVNFDPTISPSKMLQGTGMLNLKYSLANGYILSTKSFLEPFFKGGFGMSYLDAVDNDKFLPSYSYGGGLGFWLTKKKNAGIQLQQMFHRVPAFEDKSRDFFETSASFAYKFGMKDMDKDGVADKDDRCPNTPGPKELQGCPDKDKDGIIDKEDRCPNEAGPKEFSGCPDKDGDGVPDIDDKCPEDKGPVFLLGCPDKDNDSIPDYLDSCPDVKGIAMFNGCPDTDGDGVEDRNDDCPKVKGLIKFNGCPDTDGDSLPDHLDKCPDKYGPISNDGCPEEKKRKEIEEKIAFNAKSIFFESDKYVIKSSSNPMLDAIAKIIKENPREAFVIEGHTDNTGGEEHNLELSRNRANAVKEYLINAGVSGERLRSDGFGIKFPIADNNTKAGRARNRRVDITILR